MAELGQIHKYSIDIAHCTTKNRSQNTDTHYFLVRCRSSALLAVARLTLLDADAEFLPRPALQRLVRCLAAADEGTQIQFGAVFFPGFGHGLHH